MAEQGDGALPETFGAWQRRVWKLTWPVILANITIPLVGVADVAVMGQLDDPVYLGAVGVGAAMFSGIYWLFGFLRMGTTGLVAQAFGAADPARLLADVYRALGVAALLGLALLLLMAPLKWLLFYVFDATSPAVLALVADYYTIRIWGAPGLLLYLVALGVLFGLQRMRETLLLSVGFNVTNLLLDIFLALHLDLRVVGVAWGTALSEWLAAGIGLALAGRACTRLGIVLIKPRELHLLGALPRFLSLSGNLVVRTFFVQLPFFVGSVIAAQIGNVTLALHTVLMQLFFVMTYSLDGFAHTAESLSGYCYGARRPRDLHKAALYSAAWALAYAVLIGAVFLGFGAQIVALLTHTQAVRDLAPTYLPWLALAPLLCVGAFLFDGVFIGTTHIREMRNAMAAAVLIWGATLWLSTAWLYHSVWLAMSLFMASRTALLWAYYPRVVAASVRAA